MRFAADAKVPIAHAAHEIEFGADEKVPAGQTWHVEAPEKNEKLAAGHAVHLVATNEEYEPAEQFVHTVEAVIVWYCPDTQTAQAAMPGTVE